MSPEPGCVPGARPRGKRRDGDRRLSTAIPEAVCRRSALHRERLAWAVRHMTGPGRLIGHYLVGGGPRLPARESAAALIWGEGGTRTRDIRSQDHWPSGLAVGLHGALSAELPHPGNYDNVQVDRPPPLSRRGSMALPLSYSHQPRVASRLAGLEPATVAPGGFEPPTSRV